MSPNARDETSISVDAYKRTLIKSVAIAGPISLVIWLGLAFGLAPVSGMEEPVARIVFALKCCCLAVLFTFVTGVEAVAHERLHSAAIDPLTGFETRRMRINLRYLQHTLEQLLVFIPGLLALAAMVSGGEGMRAVVAITVVWILSRFAFWIGYHFGAQHRAWGMAGMVQSMLVLFYVAARFGWEVAGFAGAVAPILLFLVIEVALFRLTATPSPSASQASTSS